MGLHLFPFVIAFTSGANQCTWTYAPKDVPTELQFNFLVWVGCIWTSAGVAVLFGAGKHAIHTHAFIMAVGGMIMLGTFGNFAYCRLARRSEGSYLVPLSVLYNLVPVAVGAVLGETIGLVPSIGIGLISAASVALAREFGND